MDTALKNNSTLPGPPSPSGTSSSSTPDSAQDSPNTSPNAVPSTPIEPGQFVTTQEETVASTNIATSKAPIPTAEPPPPAPSTPNVSPLPTPPPSEPPASAQNLPSNPPAMAEQPNPSPYAAPQDQSPIPEGPSQIKRLKLAVLVFGVLILVVAIAAASWFLVLGKKMQKEVVKSETDQLQIEEPPPLSKRTKGGFADLPQIPTESTPEATSEAPNQSSP